MYTDGSKEDKRTASSFVCDDHEFSCRINDEASICTAELLAIEAAETKPQTTVEIDKGNKQTVYKNI